MRNGKVSAEKFDSMEGTGRNSCNLRIGESLLKIAQRS